MVRKSNIKSQSQKPEGNNGQSPKTIEIHARDLVVGQECPFTPGCRGRVRVYSTTSIKDIDPETGKLLMRRSLRYMHCSICNAKPINPAVTTASTLEGKKRQQNTTAGKPAMSD